MKAIGPVLKIVLIFSGFVLFCFWSAESAVTVTDMSGRQITLAKVPNRVICISPGALRQIVYLQAQDSVIGVEDLEKKFPTTRPYWIANPALGKLPSIGPGGPVTINKEPDLEKILAITPDVLFITYMSRENADALQKKIDIPVVVLTYGPFGTFNEAVYQSIQLVGSVFNKKERAQAVIDFMEQVQKDLASRIEGFSEGPKPSVYVGGIGFKGTHGIESTETLYAPFEWVKANNIATSFGKQGHLFVDKEKILEWNPAIIFIDSGGSELVRQDYSKRPDFYHSLKAFKNKQVYNLHSFNWYMTNLGTVVADAYAVGKILYPARFEDIDPAEKADEIYTFLVGKPIYRQLAKSFGNLATVPGYLQ